MPHYDGAFSCWGATTGMSHPRRTSPRLGPISRQKVVFRIGIYLPLQATSRSLNDYGFDGTWLPNLPLSRQSRRLEVDRADGSRSGSGLYGISTLFERFRRCAVDWTIPLAEPLVIRGQGVVTEGSPLNDVWDDSRYTSYTFLRHTTIGTFTANGSARGSNSGAPANPDRHLWPKGSSREPPGGRWPQPSDDY